MIGALPVLAAGVIGTCLGIAIERFRRRSEPVISTKLAREIIDVARSECTEAIVDRDIANADAAEAQAQTRLAQDAMGVLAQRLSDEMRARAATEQELADLHLKLARMSAAAQEHADAEAMGLGEAA